MPIYEHRCDKCGATFEEFEMRASSDEKKTCPECGSTDTRRMISSFSSASSGKSGSGASCSVGGGSRFT